jgi:hypothetical protein
MTDASATGPEPAQRSIFAQVAPTLVVDVVLPILLFYVLARYGVSTLWALIAGGLPPALNNLRVWIKAGRLEPLGIIVVTFLALGAAASLISGSVFFALVKDSLLTGTFGLICLFSLLAPRPLLFLIIRQFVAGEDSARVVWWNGLWEYPRFRVRMRVVTAVWGIVYLFEACLRIVFALALSPAQVITISPIMGVGALIALIVWSRRYLMALRDQRVREQEEAQSFSI